MGVVVWLQQIFAVLYYYRSKFIDIYMRFLNTEEEEEEKEAEHIDEHDQVTSLPPEIVELILQSLPFFDYPQLRATCSSWKTAIDNVMAQKHLSPLPQFPYILFSNKKTNQFLSLSQERVDTMRGCVCVGSIEGWLVLNPSHDQILFLNPVSNQKIMLPPPTTIRLQSNSSILCFKQVVASCAPNSSNCIVAARVYDLQETQVVFCRIKDKSWTILESGDAQNIRHFWSIAIHGNKLYTINCWDVDCLNVYDLEDANAVTVEHLFMPDPYRSFGICVKSCNGFKTKYDLEDSFLVTDPSSGDLFVVFQRVDKRSVRKNILFSCSRVKGFRVFKLSLSEKRWLPIDCFEDRLLFIDCIGAKLISATSLNSIASQQHLVHPNYVYFAHTYFSQSDPGMQIYEQDIGMFSLMDRSMNHFPQNQHIELDFPTQSLWFTPILG